MELTEAVERVKYVLDENLPDPYEEASGNHRETFVFMNDVRLSGTFPKINLMTGEAEPNKLNLCGKSKVNEIENEEIHIVFMSKKEFKYYEGDVKYSEKGSNEARSLVMFFLEKIKRVLIQNASELDGLNNIRFTSKSEKSETEGGTVIYASIVMSFQLNQVIE